MKETTVLVVEDNPLNMKLVRALLHKDPYRDLQAGRAETGLLLARDAKPGLRNFSRGQSRPKTEGWGLRRPLPPLEKNGG